MGDVAEAVEMQAALLGMRRACGLPVAFGGLLPAGERRLRIAELSGAATRALHGLVVATGSGLGGRAMALARPCAVTDYHASRHISHEYDVAVAAEGLRAVLAVPVVVRRKVRGVLYAALREATPLGDRALDAAVAAARDVEQALAVREEVRRLSAAAREVLVREASPREAAAPEAMAGPGAWERVRDTHSDLRALASRVTDPGLREELVALCGRLATATGSGAGRGGRLPVALTPREVDVLACVAGGATNAAAGQRLGLRPETVKGYLRSAMRKLGARTRLEAVVAARRAGALP
ncbi:helix-turn-helix transcriptional regulator [Streptomyces chryseus]